MVKKKKYNQDEGRNDQNNIITDNKEYTNDPENSSDSNTSNGRQGENSPDSTNHDKVINQDNSFDEKLAEMQDKYIRLSAEFDNYRRRTLREKIELSKYASETILLKILPFIDDFDRALKHMDTTTDCTSMKNGIDIIYGKLSEFLKQNGVKEIESMNKPFSVDLHEAVAKMPVQEEDKKGIIIDVVSKGYYLQDKVLRFSKVVVGE
jgi:molecular chaperone GrpE